MHVPQCDPSQPAHLNPDRGSFLSRVPIPGTGPESHGHWLSSQISLNIKNEVSPHGGWLYTPKKRMLNRGSSNMLLHVFHRSNLYRPHLCVALIILQSVYDSICVTKHCEVKMQPFPIWNITIQGPPVSTRLCPNNVCWFLIPFKFIYSCRVSTGVTPWLIMPYL